MYGINEKQDLEMLRREGFTEPVIAQLYQLRRVYGTSEMDQATLDTRHLEFYSLAGEDRQAHRSNILKQTLLLVFTALMELSREMRSVSAIARQSSAQSS